ncbi:hypothetical protein M9Y10_013940 [Tritrichomonas musculus]|uniref:Nucleotidyltransferase domain containing protein n=1 Tax=Tritrichomonas musculus TaxID=1915356 RepID=A0ABR2KYQ1_9EUKA
MEFFKWVDRVIGQQKVIDFPREGMEYLESNEPPTDSPYYSFHKSLVQFIKKLLPTQYDIKVRQHIIDELCQKIKDILGTMNQSLIVLPSGSCLNGTFLPEADIDLVLFVYPNPCNPVEVMELLMDQLGEFAIDNFQPIPQAKVPVLKFVVKPGIQIDLTIDELRGPLNVNAVRKIFTSYPCLLPAQVFLKCLLHKYKLDQPYIGGISSYTLQLMLLAYIQHKGIPNNITEAIIGICKFYGSEFNFTLTGIDVKGNGRFFSRYQEDCLTLESPTTMKILDPLNPNNTLGHNAFRMNQIRQEMHNVYNSIIEGKGEELLQTFDDVIKSFEEIQNNIKSYAEENLETKPE